VALEIERKFLLNDDRWRQSVSRSVAMAQGYLGGTRCSVRLRISGEQAHLNIKGMTVGARRLEFEYSVPLNDAREMLDALADGPLVEKTRHYVVTDEVTWEIDEFEGENAGLVVAEVELTSEDQAFDRPSWVGKEVTGDERYYNVYLAKHPYNGWDES
jgi:adenylate cyclase